QFETSTTHDEPGTESLKRSRDRPSIFRKHDFIIRSFGCDNVGLNDLPPRSVTQIVVGTRLNRIRNPGRATRTFDAEERCHQINFADCHASPLLVSRCAPKSIFLLSTFFGGIPSLQTLSEEFFKLSHRAAEVCA